jgi:uncharacterized protein DUF397
MSVALHGLMRASATIPSSMCICKCGCTESATLPCYLLKVLELCRLGWSAGGGRERGVNQARNGMQASQLRDVTWRKSHHSSPSGNCVEMAELPGDAVAVRNSRHPAGPALIFTRAEWDAFIGGARDGDFG